MPNSKQDKPLATRLKDFFRGCKQSGFPHPSSYEFQLQPEVVDELSSPQPVQTRLRTLRELSSQVREQRLQQHGVELLWYKVGDLVDPGQEKETRHTVLEFLTHLVLGQYNSLDMMRPVLFHFLKFHKVNEDFEKKVGLLIALTDNGKDIVHIEEQVGPLLLELLDTGMEGEVVENLLSFVSNMVKYNSAYLGQSVIARLILLLSRLSCNSSSDQEILLCLEIFKCVVMYSYVPPEALVPYISCLCRVVNLANIAADSWDTMKKLMGTHLGHSALYQLCQLVQNPENRSDTALTRGAVFFIGQSVWGAQSISSLNYSPMAVLPVFCTALENTHQLILYEVVMQVERLVTHHSENITAPSWEEAVSVLELLVTKLDILDPKHKTAVHQHLQATIGQLERLAMTDSYAGSRSRLYSLVESVSHLSPDTSVIHLISYQQATYLHPAREDWLEKLSNMMQRLYMGESRQAIRLVMLTVLSDVVSANMLLYEDQMLEKCVLPFLTSVETEPDRVVRLQAVQQVAVFATKSSGSHLGDLVDILEKIVKKKFIESAPNQDTTVVYNKKDFDIHLEAIRGLIQCMKTKLYLGPGAVAKRCFISLVSVMDHLYDKPSFTEATGEIRLEIFRMLLTIRANRDYHLGLPKTKEDVTGEDCTRRKYSFSPHVVCEKGDSDEKPEGAIVISLSRACMCVLRCLHEEKDWIVLGLVLDCLPGALQNKGLLSRYGKNISLFASALCSLFMPGHPLPTINTPVKFGREDFYCAVYPVLAALASYNRNLEHDLKSKLIRCFEGGLTSRTSNKVCIVALTAFIFQMSGSMYKLLPDVLLNLSKISATVHIAIPMLEFLSTLISLPKVFASFSTEQFLAVFAMTLPYTNPFKFNHYTVSLAHHVIIMWFLKCRLNNRREFVKFIIKGLGSNVLQPFEEGNFRKEQSLSSLNEDSSKRIRSGSLNSDTTQRRQRHMTGVPTRPNVNRNSGPDEKQALLTFHQELTETCVDLMSRYSFANCGVSPNRDKVTAFLLSQGASNSWILGTSIITVTVSGCAASANRGGFCDTCYQFCRQETEEEVGDTEDVVEVAGRKKRHQSERARRDGLPESELAEAKPLVKDDSHVPLLRASGSRRGSVVTSGDSRRGSLVTSGGGGQTQEVPVSVTQCGCWCQGWCELLVRRPSGVTSWMCRIQNGVLGSQPGSDTVADITSILRPDLGARTADTRAEVTRSASSPSIGDISPGTAASRQDKCATISEEEANLCQSLEPGQPQPMARPRAVTISSGQSPASTPASAPRVSVPVAGAISPQFMFLQLYQAAGFSAASTDKPLLLPNSKSIESSLKILDRIFCYETHKVGVVYVGPGQVSDEGAILRNQFGSSRYASFLGGLGTLVDITSTDASQVFLGGLDPRDDGQFHFVWQDDALQVVYHTATLMPTTESDPQSNKKKRHIGNDYVAIVYNNSGEKYVIGTVKGQFIFASIIVEPLDFENNRISVVCKPELEPQLGHLASPKIVSDQNLSRHVRQMALHCNLAAVIHVKSIYNKGDPYASNWLERLRHIKRLKGKVLKELNVDVDSVGTLHDFTGYV